MPTISRFYGIFIRMYFREHGVPHFHAIYGEHVASYSVDSLRRLEGWLPTPQQKLVDAWAVLHQRQLMDNVSRWQRGLPLKKIPGIR